MTFQLHVWEDGRVLVTTTGNVSDKVMQFAQDAVDEWRKSDGTIVIPDAEVIEHPLPRPDIEALIALMERNEHDRELSPYWRHGDGSMVTRAECVAAGNPFEGPAKDG